MPLDADAEPVRIDSLDGLDDAIGGARDQPGPDLLDGLVMVAVDPNLTPAVELLDPRVGLQEDGMAMGTDGRISVRQGPRLILGQVQEQRAAARR